MHKVRRSSLDTIMNPRSNRDSDVYSLVDLDSHTQVYSRNIDVIAPKKSLLECMRDAARFVLQNICVILIAGVVLYSLYLLGNYIYNAIANLFKKS